MNDIFLLLDFVCSTHKGAEFHAKFMLARCHFMVMLLNRKANFFADRNHFTADVGAAVNRLDRKVAAFDARTVATVAAFNFNSAHSRGFDITEFIKGMMTAVCELYVVKHEEFRFGPEIGRIADSGAGEIGFCLFRNGARITLVAFTAHWIENIAENDQGRAGCKRVHDRR